MRPALLATLCGVAVAQATTVLVSVTDGKTVTVSACDPTTHAPWLPINTNTTTTGISPPSESWFTNSSTIVTPPPPDETGTQPPVPTGGATLRHMESSIAGLVGFLIVGLVVL